MTLLLVLFLVIIVALLGVHLLSAIQLYKQRSLGPSIMPSIFVLTVLWTLAFISAAVNFFAYYFSH